MSTKKSSLNCEECGKFYSKNNFLPLCTKCTSKLCKNCYEPHKIPEHLLNSVPHFCSQDCQEESDAIGELEEVGKNLINEVIDFHATTCRIYGRSNPIYNSSKNPISYTYDPKTRETSYTLDFGREVKIFINLTLL